MSVRTWRCQRIKAGVKCATDNPRVKQRCASCGEPRPKPQTPKHRAALEMPYEEWIVLFGARCGICGATAGTRRLHRDHDHATGESRGLLCFRCNTALRAYMTLDWLRKSVAYLERHEARLARDRTNV